MEPDLAAHPKKSEGPPGEPPLRFLGGPSGLTGGPSQARNDGPAASLDLPIISPRLHSARSLHAATSRHPLAPPARAARLRRPPAPPARAAHSRRPLAPPACVRHAVLLALRRFRDDARDTSKKRRGSAGGRAGGSVVRPEKRLLQRCTLPPSFKRHGQMDAAGRASGERAAVAGPFAL